LNSQDVHRPSSLSQLQALVARAGPRDQIRVLGVGHSFNDLAFSSGCQVSMADLPPEVSVDRAARQARVAAGLSYAEVDGRLDEAGFALRNLASLPHITVAGTTATATATHGSGAANQNLAAAMAGLRMVTADGGVVDLRRGDDGFEGRGPPGRPGRRGQPDPGPGAVLGHQPAGLRGPAPGGAG
jgi:xylitol oxidase